MESGEVNGRLHRLLCTGRMRRKNRKHQWYKRQTCVSATRLSTSLRYPCCADTPLSPSFYSDEALWTNGPKENIEFFDYTYEEHFGEHPLPVYLPRQPVLDYMIGRVTKKCPDFFEKYMQFNTNVDSVRYVESKEKFDIVTRDMWTGEQVKHEYDYCIWSGGENGRPMMPGPLVNLFQEGGYAGRIIHSTDTTNFEEDTKGKRVLIIGGSYSAEDLALM